MAQVKKPHLKDKKAKEKTDARDQSDDDVEILNKAHEDQQANDEKMKDKPDVEMDSHKTINPRRIWSKRSTTSSKSLYEIASTPQRVTKETDTTTEAIEKKSKREVDKETRELIQQMKDLSLQMKHELDQWRAAGATSTEQVQGQQNNMQAQLDRLTEIANRHDEEIDDLRGLSDFTHEIVFEREAKYTTLKMIIKSWPQNATYYDRVRVTDWLLQQAHVQQQTKQEHGYYTSGRKFVLSPVTILTFEDQDTHHMFEKFAYTSFSAKKPLYYWDSYGNYMQHWKGGWHKLVITNYMGKIDQTINLALITVLHILTSSEQTGYAGKDQLSHRPSDKQIFDLNTKSAVAKATYDKDQGVPAIVLQKSFVEVVRTNWHEAWRVAHRDHPRFSDYSRFPYVCTFAGARTEEGTNDDEPKNE